MSNLYIRVRTGFYTHRKTAKLRSILGDSAFWIVPRIWAYAAENQPDGNLSTYTTKELETLIGYAPSNATSMLDALKCSGFIDESGMIHGWGEHNGYHQSFADRAKKAAAARWAKEKPPTPPKEYIETGNRKQDSGDKHCLEHACSIENVEIVGILTYLNEKTGRNFRALDKNITFIKGRLSEPGVDAQGIKIMIDRQWARWHGTQWEEYMRPETLFNKTKFESYYSSKDLPVIKENVNGNHQIKPDHEKGF